MTGNGEESRLLFQDNPQPMWVYDRETLRFLEVNHAALDLFGYSRAEFLRMRLTDVRVDDAAVAGAWRYRLKNGRIFDVEVAVRDIRVRQRPAALAVLTDVTHREQLEAQLLQSQKMEAVGMLAGGIAHDFNNLLTIINGYSQLLLGSLTPGDRNRTAVEQIMKAGERAAALTSQLLAFSRRQTIQPRVLDLNLLVGSLALMLRRLIGEDIDLRLDLGKELGKVNADPGQVEQVIMNLAVNSRDAMPKGGVLTLRTGNTRLSEEYIGVYTPVKAGNYVMLEVSDTGVGMDAATRSRLFEPFFTTKAHGRGTGLGLSIVFGIVRQAGGNVEVASEPGAGTTFKIYLPSVEQPLVLETETKDVEQARGTETILLVEDEEMVRRLVRETLEQEGYTVLEAATPAQARRIARTHTGPIPLMITDVVMPRESGRSLAARLAVARPEMKVLYMSGYTDTGVIRDGGAFTEEEFLQKPFTPGALKRKVRRMLQSLDNGKTRGAGG